MSLFKKDKDHKENKKSEADANVEDRQTIVQPDPNAEDSQEYIRENAKKGEPMPVPNTVGYNPVVSKI